VNKKKLSTKDKILDVAGKLFAQNGFSGTSVRDISSAAEVNLAAINYHYENKENLFKACFAQAYLDLDTEMNKIDSELATEDLAMEIYCILLKDSDNIRQTFTMMIADNESEDCFNMADLPQIKKGVPPGFDCLSRSISKQCGPNISPYGIFWAVTAIFNQLIHTSLISSSGFFNEVSQTNKVFQKKMLSDGVKFQVRAVLAFLQSHTKEFENPDFAAMWGNEKE
jgi:hypothetical protein